MLLKLSNSDEFAIIDDEDYEKVKPYVWRYGHSGYPQRTDSWLQDGIRKWAIVTIHMEIMGRKPGLFMDHINHNRLDNRKENLRFVTRAQNNQNALRKVGKSGYRGVAFHKNSKWRAKIMCEKKNYELGGFETPQEAALAYNELARKHHGEFAILNEF